MATERYDTNGINKVLDFENVTLSIVVESQGPSTSHERRSHSWETSKDMGTQSNPASNHVMEEHNARTSLKKQA